MLEPALLRRFSDLFMGGDHAYGIWHPKHGPKTEPGTPTTIEWTNHLEGICGLGRIPIRMDDNACRFAAIDFDIDDVDHVELAKKVEALGLPLIVCRSKSGAAHFFLFIRGWVEARRVRLWLAKTVRQLHLSKHELFPKQDVVDKANKGNWINLPYFDCANTKRYAITATGEILSLAAFLDLAEQKQVSPDTFPDVVATTPKPSDSAQEADQPSVQPLLDSCAFVKHCEEHATSLNEPLWYGLACNLALLRGGRDAFHRLSKLDVGRYNEPVANQKFSHAIQAAKPHTCVKIGELGFPCPKMLDDGRCSINGGRAPIALADRHLALIYELNERHAVIPVGGRTLILSERTDPLFHRQDFVLSTPHDLKTLYANHLIQVGRKQIDAATLWLRHKRRREYQSILFAPGQEIAGHYNLWRGFSVSPRKGDCSLYLAHLHDNIADGNAQTYSYLLAFMADAVQRPSVRPGIALVMRGPQGTGKGVMAVQFGLLFGQHFVHVQRSRHLVGNFNAHMKDALLVFADEAYWAGDKASEGALKALVTEDALPIEFKGKDTIYVRNHVRLIIASNHAWVVPAGLEERRFFVFDVGAARMQDSRYFHALVTQMENGGREALLHYLQTYDLSGIDLRRFPQTSALIENKFLSMSPAEKFWFEKLLAGALRDDADQWEEWVFCSRLHDEFVVSAGKSGQYRKGTETELGQTLKRLVPGLGKSQKLDYPPEGGKRRVWVWTFPSLADCRKAFDIASKFSHEWPEESAARRAAQRSEF